MTNSPIQGLIVPLLTPVDDQEQVHYPYLEQLVEHVIDGGVNAIFAMGTSGEFSRLDADTRGRVLAAAVKNAAGRVPVYAGVSDCGTQRVISHIRRAEDAGVSAVVTTLPYYFPNTSKNEAVQFFSDVAAATALPVILYNLPAAIGTSIDLDVLDEVFPIENIAAIKDSSGDIAYLKKLLSRYRGKTKPFSVLVGDEKALFSGLSMGIDGIVPSLANPYPKLLKAAYDSAAVKDIGKLKYYCDIVNDMNNLNGYSDGWMSPNVWRKAALEIMGVMNSCFTRPYTPVDTSTRELIRQTAARYRELFPPAEAAQAIRFH